MNNTTAFIKAHPEMMARIKKLADDIDAQAINFEPTIQPLHDRIVVERLPDEDQERSGLIVIPEVARKQSMKARVLAVGPGAWRDGEFVKTAVKPGDIVVLPGYGGQHPDWEGKQQMIIQEGDIGGILEHA